MGSKKVVIFIGFFLWFLFSLSPGLGEADLYVYSDPEGSIVVTHAPLAKEKGKLLSTYRSPSQKPRGNLSRNLDRFSNEISMASIRFGVEEDLIRAVIKAESDFDPYAISSAGALGLMQLMPQTAKRMGVDNSFDPRQNINGGVRYLMMLSEQFDDLRLAIAAYHAGENRVAAYGDIPPIPATLEYVDRVLHFYQGFQKISKPTKKIYKITLPTGEVLYSTSRDTTQKKGIYFKVD